MSDGVITTLRIAGSRIAALGTKPQAGDLVIDAGGDRVLPGLINAHDHLQLNSLPCLGFGKRYDHVRDWIDDIQLRRRSDPVFEAGIAVARDARLLIGGVKNLLSGVTTVAHHDPLYPFLSDADFPTHVVAEYGWAHSLYLGGEAQVRSSYQRTPAHWPWMIHAAEGLGEDAANEFERLDALGCIGANTLLVHGIALDQAQRIRIDRAAAGLIWCPSSNLRLFGKTAEVSDLLAQGRLALGTDSRLSGARDLLDELRVAAEIGELGDSMLQSLVTRDNARLLRLPDRGSLLAGFRADILFISAGAQLSAMHRRDVRLVLREGCAQYGDKDYLQYFAPPANWVEVRVDGKPKILSSKVAALLSNAGMSEVGLDISGIAWRAA
ncbi:MAG TPA: amidohydrolase family protein [Steroidobacteraceae bacterium]